VSLSSGDEVPHIFTRKSRIQPGEFLITSAKRLLQHNPSESGQTAEASICPLCANRVITHCSKRHRLFDHLVGAQQERSRDRQPHQIVPRHGCASYRLGGRCRDPCLRPPHLMSAQQIKISRNSGWPTIRKTTLKKRRLASPNTVRLAALKPEAPEGREPCQHIFLFWTQPLDIAQ